MAESHQRSSLEPDCDKCSALCCIAPSFAKSESFAFDKTAGVRCKHMTDDYRCEIHNVLPDKGHQGCVDYQCYGAGQKVTQDIYQGRTWMTHPDEAEEIFSVYFAVKAVHELLGYLAGGLALCEDPQISDEIEKMQDELEEMTLVDPQALKDIQLPPLEKRVSSLLQAVGTSIK